MNKNSYPEYKNWRSIQDRCALTTGFYYKNGIKVCSEWSDFFKFYEDMGPRPSKLHTIDRIDNGLGYSKENCRWATKTEQMLNRSIQRNNKSGFRGVCFRKSTGRWRAVIAINGVRQEIGTYNTDEEAAVAYDSAAIQLHGNFAKTNILYN